MCSGRCRRRVAVSSRNACGVFGGVLVDRLVRGRGVADDLVFDVGDVHHVIELVAARVQPAAQDVLERERPQVADVDVVVNRRAAGVHAHDVVVQGGEGLHLLGEGVVETQGHSERILLC